jgi:cyclic pyranopterin phosphate synthase
MNHQQDNIQSGERESRLIDRYGRRIDYIRISVTDRCDLRCQYCMSEKMQFVPREQLLSLEELHQIAAAFVELGVSKIRITGGEPLVRRNILTLFENLGQLDGLHDLTLTTNGSQLAKYAPLLKDAGVTRINISLDTLRPDLFHEMTRTGEIHKTLEGIEAAMEQGFDRIKINMVVLKGRNHHEVPDLLRFAIERNIDISFIENMPMGITGEHNHHDSYYSSDDIIADLSQQYSLEPTRIKTAGPARYYRMDAHPNTRVGFISPHSHNFCDDCNRVRLTAEGLLLLCLGQEHSVDLKRIIRDHPYDTELLHDTIIRSLDIKPRGHEFNIGSHEILLRHMNMTGG